MKNFRSENSRPQRGPGSQKPAGRRNSAGDGNKQDSFRTNRGEGKREAPFKPGSSRYGQAKPSAQKRAFSEGGAPSYRKNEGEKGSDRFDPRARKPARSFSSAKNTGENSSAPEKRFSSPRFRDNDNKRPAFDKKKNFGGGFPASEAAQRRHVKGDRPEKPVLRARKSRAGQESGPIRLNRFIANAGICSRRKADELIEAGVITVNGAVVDELGFKVDPANDQIRYNGELLRREKKVYVLLNKPKDYLTTTEDPHERRTVMQLVAKAGGDRIYPVGRLDRNTTGLLLLTNDGDLAEKLSHPRNNVTKIYHVELSKNLTQGDFNKIAYGLELEDGFIKPDDLSFVQGASKREVGIQIHSGRNRIVRRIFEHLGYEVVKLDRTIYANLTKKDLPRGRWRYLEEKELIQLKHFVQ